jgi:hypothetical protein
MSKLDGSEFKLYYKATAITSNADADIKADTLIEATEVANVTRNSERSQSDFAARSGVITTTGPAKRGFTFDIAYDTTDAFYTALEAAHDGNNEIALAACDGDYSTAGTKGSVANCYIVNFSLNEPDSGPATVSVEAASSSQVNWGYVAPA